MDKSKEQNIIFNIIAVLCIIFFCISLAPKTLQNDTFYTLKIGEYIFQNGISDLTQDLYSWHDLKYTYPHWLYDLGMFLIYDNFGDLGIYISTMVFASLLGILVYALSSEKSNNKILSLFITLGAMYLIKDFIAARAQLITFILFVFEVFCIEKFLKTHKKIYPVFLIIIPILITNLHCAVFPFYFILALPYIGEYVLLFIEDLDLDKRLVSGILKLVKKVTKKEERKEKLENKIEKIKFDISERNRKREIIRKNPYKLKVEKNKYVIALIVIMLIAGLTGFLNPAGTGAYTYLYKTLQGNTTASINEHQPIVLANNSEFAITLVMFLVILIFSDTKIRLSDLFMLAGLIFLSFTSQRQVSMFAIFCGPILVKMIADMFEKYDGQTTQKLMDFFTNWFGAIVLICLVFIISVNRLKPKIKDSYIDVASYPVVAAEWMLENMDVENMKLYNEYNYGSYLVFKGIPVFIDSRCDLYTPEFNEDKKNNIEGRDIFTDALDIASVSVNYDDKFEEYGVTHILTYSNSRLALVLEKDDNYASVQYFGNFRIFERITEEK